MEKINFIFRNLKTVDDDAKGAWHLSCRSIPHSICIFSSIFCSDVFWIVKLRFRIRMIYCVCVEYVSALCWLLIFYLPLAFSNVHFISVVTLQMNRYSIEFYFHGFCCCCWCWLFLFSSQLALLVLRPLLVMCWIYTLGNYGLNTLCERAGRVCRCGKNVMSIQGNLRWTRKVDVWIEVGAGWC